MTQAVGMRIMARSMLRPRLAAVLLAFFGGSIALPTQAQSLMGNTGLIVTPTAEMHGDGMLSLGAGWLHEEASSYEAGNAIAPYYLALTFLPFLEIGVRFSPLAGTNDALGDRTPFVRVQVLRDSGRFAPAVAVGPRRPRAAAGVRAALRVDGGRQPRRHRGGLSPPLRPTIEERFGVRSGVAPIPAGGATEAW